tara:strand:- start:797 stop:1282 length:486 start_codon:yes stop_codon:yes gene_type:complete
MIRELTSQDIESVLAINNNAVPTVNSLNISDLLDITGMSQKTWVVEDGESIGGVLIVIGSGESYKSTNYIWLKSQFTNFCYVDRIIIDPSNKRKGYGRLLYSALEDHAISIGVNLLLCEVNIEPKNFQSLSFHESLGWVPFQDREHGPGKAVRYFQKSISR